jgi:hypothetical protein
VKRDIPKGAEKFDGKNVLAYGEVTGHAHRVTSGTVEFLKFQAKTYLRVIDTATLKHEEHKTIVLPPGDYEYGNTSEYDYDLEESKRVAD